MSESVSQDTYACVVFLLEGYVYQRLEYRLHRNEFPSVESEPPNPKCFSRFLCYFTVFTVFLTLKSGETIYWHTVEDSHCLPHPSLMMRWRRVCVTLCKRRRRKGGWSDISRPTTGAVVMHVHFFCPRSCVHRVVSRQSWAAAPLQARWPKHVLSACPMLGLETPNLRWLGPGRREIQVPVMEYLGLAWGISAVWKEAVCLLYNMIMERQLHRAAWWMQGPVECSPCFLPPCPAPQCLAVCSPRCRRSSLPWREDPVHLWCCWWSPGRTGASWGYIASTSSSARTAYRGSFQVCPRVLPPWQSAALVHWTCPGTAVLLK